MSTRIVHVCSHQSARDVTRRTTYKQIKADVLEAGRFSVFEATDNERAAELFQRLHSDPELEIVGMPFPWVGIRRRARSDQRAEPRRGAVPSERR